MKTQKRVMISVRLSPEKHMRLKLALDKRRQHAQTLIEGLIDEFLEAEEKKHRPGPLSVKNQTNLTDPH